MPTFYWLHDLLLYDFIRQHLEMFPIKIRIDLSEYLDEMSSQNRRARFERFNLVESESDPFI